MQRHLLMKQLAASFKQFAQLSQHTLAEIRLLEAVIAAHLGLIGTQTLEGRRREVKTSSRQIICVFYTIDRVFSSSRT